MNASAEMWGCQNISRELIKRMLANKGEKSRGTFAFSPTEQTIVDHIWRLEAGLAQVSI